ASPALQKLAVAGLALELAALDDDATAREDGLDHALNFLALVCVVVNVHVARLDAQGLFLLRVEDDYVRVGADGDCAFAREEAKHLCGGGRGQLDEAVER